jgi:UDP-glucose 4-epimerase
MSCSIAVVGGAGYIGSVFVEALVARGERVVVIDNLAMGHAEAVPAEASFHALDIRERAAIERVFREHEVGAVAHFAAASLVGESVTDPAKYMENNVAGTLSLLAAMRATGVPRLVFSSTAAVYGEPLRVPIDEEHPCAPVNPYGLTKRFMEQVMEAYSAAYGMTFTALRYFNAAGATAARGEDHRPETHLIPLVLQAAAGKLPHIGVFGTDYPTPDGTCVRDYVHVSDLAEAHLLALDRMAAGGGSLVCNLGNGAGFSVREVIATCREVTGRDIAVKELPRRAGDPARLVASADRAAKELGWRPRRPDLRTAVEDAWRWHVAHPDGYARAT